MSKLGFLRRVSVGVLDQMVSSGSNFASTLMAARLLDQADFGAYSVAMVIFVVVLGFCRALCLEALLVRPGDDAETAARSGSSAVASAIWVGVLAGTAVAAAALALGGDLRASLLVVAVATPVVLIQDALRYMSFSVGRPKDALLSDVAWVVLMALGYVLIISMDLESPASLVAVWMVAGSLAGLGHLFVMQMVPPLRSGLRWVFSQRDLSLPYALNFISGQGAGYMSALFLAAAAGVQAAGALRGALTLFGPANTLFAGAYVVLVPEGRRLVARSPDAFRRLCVMAGATLGALAVATTVLLTVMPDELGRAVLGSTWPSARELVPRLGVAAIGSAVLSGALVGLSALAQAGRILRTRLLTLPTTLGLPVLGASVAGAKGLATGLIVSVWITVFAYWHVLTTSLRDGTANDIDESTQVLPPPA